MKLKDFLKLLNFRRYQHCKKIFKSPLWEAMLKTTFYRKKVYSLEFHKGGVFEFTNPPMARNLWNYLLTTKENPFPVFAEKGVVKFNFQGDTLSLRLDQTDYYHFEEIFIQDTYKINHLREKLDTVVDLGGNVGYFSCRISPWANRVIAVEPIKANCKMAEINFSGCKNSDKIKLLNYAVTSKSGEILPIYLDETNVGGNSLYRDWIPESQEKPCEKAETISLPDLFEREKISRCDLLKCDIEGSEYEVFLDTDPKILKKIEHILMECHFWDPSSKDKFEELKKLFAKSGFNISVEKDMAEINRMIEEKGRDSSIIEIIRKK